MKKMYYIGIDAGSEFCKFFVLSRENKIITKGLLPIGGDPEAIIENTITTLRKKTLKISNKESPVVLTGRNGESFQKKKHVKYISEFQSLAKASYTYNPNIKMVVDTGSFISKVLKLEQGKIVDYALNDVCSSGAGIFLTLVSKSLDISLEELSQLALKSSKPISITSQCSIFAESEVIYLMNEGNKIEDIARGVCDSIVGRLIPQIQKLSPEPVIIFTGGVSKNQAIKNRLEDALGQKIQVVNESIGGEFFNAYGAALTNCERIPHLLGRGWFN